MNCLEDDDISDTVWKSSAAPGVGKQVQSFYLSSTFVCCRSFSGFSAVAPESIHVCMRKRVSSECEIKSG